jgi:ABC-type antimicrobial peptide transport system permease subunit
MAFNDVGPGYFRTMKTQILSGREFAKNDRMLNVCVLNESAAAFLFPHQEAMGRFVRATDEREFPVGTTCRVIGISADAKFSDVRRGPPHTIYFPLSLQRFDTHLGNLVFLINSDSKASAIAAFRQTLAELAPTVPLVLFVTLREQMDAALGSEELITLLSNFFGVLALLLSSLGLYGLLSASVVQRTSEIGLRIALGADRRSVLRMILHEALELLGWGMLAGAVVLLLTTHVVTAMLHGVSGFDPVTLIGVAFVLTSVTVTAAFLPALRAATVDPIQALRAD